MGNESIGGSFSTYDNYTIYGTWNWQTIPSITTGSLVTTTGTQTLTNKTLTSPAVTGLTGTQTSPTITTPTMTSPVVTGNAGTGLIFCKQCLFTEDATSTIHTATFTIPAGSVLLDIIVVPQVLWTGGTAAFTCGDAASANGWF